MWATYLTPSQLYGKKLFVDQKTRSNFYKTPPFASAIMNIMDTRLCSYCFLSHGSGCSQIFSIWLARISTKHKGRSNNGSQSNSRGLSHRHAVSDGSGGGQPCRVRETSIRGNGVVPHYRVSGWLTRRGQDWRLDGDDRRRRCLERGADARGNLPVHGRCRCRLQEGTTGRCHLNHEARGPALWGPRGGRKGPVRQCVVHRHAQGGLTAELALYVMCSCMVAMGFAAYGSKTHSHHATTQKPLRTAEGSEDLTGKET